MKEEKRCQNALNLIMTRIVASKMGNSLFASFLHDSRQERIALHATHRIETNYPFKQFKDRVSFLVLLIFCRPQY
jgi:hypothetical protein